MPNRKKYRPLIWAVLVSLCLTVFSATGCGAGETGNASRQATTEQDEVAAKAEKILRSMSTAEKLGQMVMIGVMGTDIDNDNRFMLNQYHIGNIILFDRNLENSEQVKNFTANLQKNADGKIPLLIGIDEEGGRVSRMPQIVPPPPSQRALGNDGDLTAIENNAKNIADELVPLGFNLDFAPVADLGADNERSFSNEPQKAADMVCAAVDGFLAGKIVPCLKHFPGLGRGEADTHKDIVTVRASAEELLAEDVLPFKTVIDKYPHDKFMVMVSHIDYPAFDENNPASLSPAVQQDLLRRELNFDGVIITDDTVMGALAKRYSIDQTAIMAVAAGADIVMVGHEYENATKVYLSLLEAAEKGTISQERIDDSVRRILRLKLQMQK